MSWCCCNGAKLAIITPIPPGLAIQPAALPCGHQCPICHQETPFTPAGQSCSLHQNRDNFTLPSQPMPRLVDELQSMETQTDGHVPVSATDEWFQSMPNRPRTLDSQPVSAQQFQSLPSRPRTLDSQQQFHSLASRPRTLSSQGVSAQQFRSLASRPRTLDSQAISGQQFQSLPTGSVSPSGIPANFTRLAQWGSPDKVADLQAESFSISMQVQSGSPPRRSTSPVRRPIPNIVTDPGTSSEASNRVQRQAQSSGTGGWFNLPSSLQQQQQQQRQPLPYQDSRSRAASGRTSSSGYRSRSPQVSRSPGARVTFIGNENLNQSRLGSNMPVSVNYSSMMGQIAPQRQSQRSNAVYVPSGGSPSPRPSTRRPVVAYEDSSAHGGEIVVEETREEVIEHLPGGGVKKTVSTVSSTYSVGE